MDAARTSKLTVRQAAAAVGVSPKTIRRRIAEGDLSASKELRGKQEVVFIDGSELARYAEGANLRLDLDRLGQQPVNAVLSNGHEGAQVSVEGESVHVAAREDHGTAVDSSEADRGLRGQVGTLEGMVAELRTALDEARRRETWLQERVQAAEQAAERERERASEERQKFLDLIPKALPPAPPWWQRIFRGKGDSGNG